MSDGIQEQNTEEDGTIPLPTEANSALQEANLRAKDNEGRLRKVSSAYKQLQGEMQALRERHARQREQDQKVMKAQVVKDLFEPLQNLRRSVDAMGSAGIEDDVLSGIQMVGRNFMEAFEQMGLEKVPGVGTPFSPDVHEALSVIPVAIPAADGRVIEVFSEGYRVGDTLIAPAKVVIGKYTAPPEPEAVKAEDSEGEE
jgi:molecular chaperone GrpE